MVKRISQSLRLLHNRRPVRRSRRCCSRNVTWWFDAAPGEEAVTFVDKVKKFDVAQLTAAQLRVKQRLQKVNERLATSTPRKRPDIDVFKKIISDTESESEYDDKDDSDQEDTFTFKKSTKPD